MISQCPDSTFTSISILLTSIRAKQTCIAELVNSVYMIIEDDIDTRLTLLELYDLMLEDDRDIIDEYDFATDTISVVLGSSMVCKQIANRIKEMKNEILQKLSITDSDLDDDSVAIQVGFLFDQGLRLESFLRSLQINYNDNY